MSSARRAPLAERVALVTGAGRGIGRATALALAEAGAWVALLDRDGKAATAAARQIEDATGRCVLPVQADVTMPTQVRRAVRRTVGRLGRLDILVNNAGVWAHGHLGEIRARDWDRVLAVNLKGLLLCTQEVLPHMRRQKAGKIVNMASAAGLGPVPAWTAYCISKAGAIMLSRVAAEELRSDGIQVHCLCPGAVHTDLVRRITARTGDRFPHAMDPAQVAAAVVGLVTPFRSRETGRIVQLAAGVSTEVVP
ncbi:MAG: SDR family oxidoreductase [Candidatus Latescibacterota bacterium]